jgi:hypothetical protein
VQPGEDLVERGRCDLTGLVGGLGGSEVDDVAARTPDGQGAELHALIVPQGRWPRLAIAAQSPAPPTCIALRQNR